MVIYEEQNYYNTPAANQRNWSEREGVRGVCVCFGQPSGANEVQTQAKTRGGGCLKTMHDLHVNALW